MQSKPPRPDPTQYFCPSCHLHLLSWDPPSKTVEMFHKVALWEAFGTREVRLICQYCEGATDVVPGTLVDVLRDRYGLAAPSPDAPRPSSGT